MNNNNNKNTKKYLEIFFDKEEITYDGQYISVYEFNNIINNQFKELIELFNNREKEIEKINNNTNFIKKTIYKEILTSIEFHTNEEQNLQEIKFIFENNIRFCNPHYFKFSKNIKSDKIYFSGISRKPKERINNFFKENIEYISNVLYTMEYYNDEYGITFNWFGINKIINNNYKNNFPQIPTKFKISEEEKNINAKYIEQSLSYDNFKINININTFNPITIKLKNDEFDNLLITEESLSNLTYKNYEELLKRIPIKIDELNSFYKNIIINSLEKNKIKQLKK